MNYPWLQEGLDLTTVVGTPSNSQINQAIHEAKPSATTGWIVWAEAAPDVVTYPDLARAIWGKLTGGVRSGEFYWYNGADWYPWTIPPGSLTGDAFADGSISVMKLAPGGSLQILRTKVVPANGVEWVDANSIFSANLIPVNSLANAPAAGYVLTSTTGGVWTQELFSTLWAGQFGQTSIPLIQIYDVDGTYLPNQVPYVAATGGPVQPGYVDQLLRDDQITRRKLQWRCTAATITAGAVAIDGQTSSGYELSLSANVTTFDVSLAAGQSVTIAITQVGGFTISGWNASIKWAGGSAPTITSTAGKTDVITFVKLGTTIYASIVQNF
jgi:hypothetical protein